MDSIATPAGASPDRHLDEHIRLAQGAVEQKYLFRKIGLPFDYPSNPDDFPSKVFATAKEARSNQPNPSGLGTGYHYSCRNHALLFDAYLLRLETGIEGPNDEAILDRLIGGLIRLATVAPKSFLVGGLAPDGRGFYAQPRRENHAAWSFAVCRGLDTAAIAPESQEKFRSIAGKWIDRVKREKYRLLTVDGKPVPGGDMSRPEPDNGPFLLAMLLTAARASGEARDYDLYSLTAEEESRARLGPFTPDGGWEKALPQLLWRQAAWQIIADHDPLPERAAIARERLREHALAAVAFLNHWRRWNQEEAGEAVDFNWRAFPPLPLDQSPYGFLPPASWKRLDDEQAVENSLAAAYVALLAGDPALLEAHAGEMEDCFAAVPWDSLLTLSAIAPVIGVHCRGVELGLWDKDLYQVHREQPSAEISIAAKYLEPDYDEAHPGQAGHQAPPPGKNKTGERGRGEGGPTRKRRRRKRR